MNIKFFKKRGGSAGRTKKYRTNKYLPPVLDISGLFRATLNVDELNKKLC